MFFFFNDTATTEIYTLSLHDALPISVVGTRPILASQVEEQLVLAQSQGQKVPEDSAGRDAARRQVLPQMGDEELLVQQAERDTTIKGTDQEVQDAGEQTLPNVRKQFNSNPEVPGPP